LKLKRSLGPGFDKKVVSEIDARLQGLRSQGISILLAVESGSRAWGFPSPDSDYDCRFIYARPKDEYVTLFPKRDVIEFPTDAVLDVNGWDIAKALGLLFKGNAVVVEWLTSPNVYTGDESFRAEALKLARKIVRPDAVARHYLHLGERQRRTYFADERDISLKKIFYALRPAIALRWLRLHSGVAVAPMNFQALVAETDLPANVVTIIDALLARKAVTREMGSGPLPKALGKLIDSEFARAKDIWIIDRIPDRADDEESADAFLRKWISRN
jgi:predicted nucleotidyltransferase